MDTTLPSREAKRSDPEPEVSHRSQREQIEERLAEISYGKRNYRSLFPRHSFLKGGERLMNNSL